MKPNLPTDDPLIADDPLTVALAEIERLQGDLAMAVGNPCAGCQAEVERLREALRLIRGRYFPADDDARIAWANETFKIARDALGDDR